MRLVLLLLALSVASACVTPRVCTRHFVYCDHCGTRLRCLNTDCPRHHR